MAGLFGHDSSGCRDIKSQITEFLWRSMILGNQGFLKAIIAVFGGPVMACIAITACELTVFGKLHAV